MSARLVGDRKQEVGRAMREVLPAGCYCGLLVTYMWLLARSERTTLAVVIVTVPCRSGLRQQNESRDPSLTLLLRLTPHHSLSTSSHSSQCRGFSAALSGAP